MQIEILFNHVAAQEKMEQLMGAYFKVSSRYGHCHPKTKEVSADYDKVRDLCIKHMGHDAPCLQVDPMLWDLYSDLYKDEFNFRPHVGSYKHVTDYVNARKMEG